MQATTKNNQGIPVCSKHKNASLQDMRCLCGELLELKEGKFGIYFRCERCGNVNAKRVFETNNIKNDVEDISREAPKTSKRAEITTTSDDPLYFD